jgi:tetratricopeptide (TPR) repeat protein
MLARSFEIDPRVAGLFEHTLSVPEAVDLLEKNTRHIVSSNDIGTDIAGGFLEAVAETSVLHRLGWAVREARGSAPPWAGRQIEETADKAVQRVAGACAAHRSDVTVQLNLAEFLSIVEDYQGADHIFSQVERLGGMYAKGYTTWGCTLYSLKKYGKACATFSKAAKLADPKSFVGDVLVKWGWSLARTGQREEAEKRFLAAVRQEEEEPKYHFQYGKAFAYWKEHEKAVAQFRKATDGPWPYRAAYAEWVHSLNELGRSKEAVELVCRAILFRPTKGALYSGVVYEALQKLPKQDYEAARNRIVEVVQGLRRSMDASWLPDIHLARCLARLGDPDLAARLLYRLELFMPWEDRLGWMTRSATEYVAWGEAYLEVGRPKAALEKFKSALRADPLNTEACRGLAQAYALSGEPAKAEETFKKIQQLGPAKPRVGSDGPGVE